MTPLPLRQVVAAGCASMSLAADLDAGRAVETLCAARDAGIHVFDTARAYAPVADPTHNERLLRRAFGGSDDITVMTKGGHFRTGEARFEVDNSPARLRRDVEDSLRALGTDRLDRFFVHRADGGIDIADAFGALGELRDEGKIARLGISNATDEQIRHAHAAVGIDAVQNRFSIGVDPVTAMACADELGLSFFAYSPFGGPGSAASLAAVLPHLAAIARQRSVSIHRLALRGILSLSPAASVIVGVTRAETARDSAPAADDGWDDECTTALALDRQVSPR